MASNKMAGIEGTNEAPANLLAEVADDNRHIRMSDAQYAFWGSVVEAVDATVPVVEPFCPRDFLTPEVRVTLPASYFHFLSVRYRTLLETDDIVELDSKYHRSLVPENEYNPSVKHVQDLKQALIERRLYPNETRMATFSGSGPTRAAVHEAMASPAAMDAYVRKIDGMVHINRVYTAAWPELAGGLIAAGKAEMDAMKAQLAKEFEAERNVLAMERDYAKSALEKMRNQHTAALQEAAENHKKEVAALKGELALLKAEQKVTIAELVESYRLDKESVAKQHQQALEDLRR